MFINIIGYSSAVAMTVEVVVQLSKLQVFLAHMF